MNELFLRDVRLEAKLGIYKVVESPGKYKEADGGVWSAEEIAEHWQVISKI